MVKSNTPLSILLCEDHPINARIAQKVLQQFNCNITLATTGEETVEHYANDKNAYDIIILDMLLPTIHGLECAKYLREEAVKRQETKNIPIFAWTADIDAIIKDDRLVYVNGILRKPFSITCPLFLHVMQNYRN